MGRDTVQEMMMTYLLGTGLMLGLASATIPAATIDHSITIDHRTGPIDARYRGTVAVEHKQVGSIAPPGRASTLRCMWSANMIVDRHATAATGTTMMRNIVRDNVVSGSRPGWCDKHRGSIAKEVAAKVKDMDSHVVAVAQEDHDVLRAELDRAHGETRTG
ncbi:hypothetical protein KCP91_03835 [Microvirga sp. SRT01]|uniref:UrcA family protein n=1 Tax=Sphingomonas longa TaxID=2778730 RepID=A0ABS2D3J9_9SPHN|nr:MULTISPECIES: hypothetical protein [Alphaproteobacteria]MBM6575487.1 hypothetical protein [Sphingomonas sp. BT552]MBR7708535.1 hypothetical protein [Microvirga sp. SRT01]